MIGVDGARYKSMEFVGDGVANLTMDDRFTICNMAIEAGGKNGIFPVDDRTLTYIREHSSKPCQVYEADPDAVYNEEYTIDLSSLRPTVSFPHLPSNTKTIDEVGEIRIDQSVIGSCTNGRLSDLRAAAAIMKGRKVADHVRCIVIPATQQIYLDALREGLIEGRSSCVDTDLRTVPGGLYGDTGFKGALHIDNKPQLCRQDGSCGFGNLSGEPCGRGSKCIDRENQFS